MRFFRNVTAWYQKANQFAKALILSTLQVSATDGEMAKKKVNEFFKGIPSLIAFACMMFNGFAVFSCLVGGRILGLIFFLCSGLVLFWWYANRFSMKQTIYKEAKERYKNMEELFESAHIDMDIFYKMFPDWTSALSMYFTIHALQAFSRFAADFEQKKSNAKNSYKGMAARVNAMQVFGLSSLNGVTEDSLKRMYRKLAKKYHPDAHPGDAVCEAKFKELSMAYATLSQCI